MKRTLTTLMAFVLLVSMCVLLVACSGGGTGAVGQVSDQQWKDTLGVDLSVADNFTISFINQPTYPQSQAEEYGEWYSYDNTYYVDQVNQQILSVLTTVRWVEPDVSTETGYFETNISTEYICIENGVYKKYEKLNDKAWEAEDITKAAFIDAFENTLTINAMVSLYSDPIMKSVFKYDAEEKCYTLIQFSGIGNIKIYFYNNGYSMVSQISSLQTQTINVLDADKTSVERPSDLQ